MCPRSTHVSGVDSRSLWGVYLWVLSDTPTECVTQCAASSLGYWVTHPLSVLPSVPTSHPWNKTHHTNHALSRTCAWNQTWYHLHFRVTFFNNYTIKQRGVYLHWRLLVVTATASPRAFLLHGMSSIYNQWSHPRIHVCTGKPPCLQHPTSSRYDVLVPLFHA